MAYKGDVFIPSNIKHQNKYKKLFSDTALFALSTFSSKLLSILMLPFYTRMLDEASMGTADLIFSTGNLITPLATIGIAESVIRFGLDRSYKKDEVFSTGILITLIGILFVLLFAPLLDLVTPIQYYTKLIYLYVASACLKSICSQFVRSRGLVRLFAVDGILSTVFVVIFNIIFLAVFKLSVTGFVLSTILADSLSILFLFIMGSLYKYIKLKINPRVVKNMLIFSIPMIPNAISWWITNASDRYMVTFFWDIKESGIYSISYKIPTIISAISMVFSKAWQLSAFKEKSGPQRERFFSNVFKLYQMFIMIGVSFIIMLVQPLTSILVSDRFYESWRYAPLLLLGVGYSCFVTFLGSVYMAEKKNVMSMVSTVSGAILNIILNLILIPPFGAQGAAIATCSSFVFVFIFRAVDTRRLIRIKYGIQRLSLATVIILLQTLLSLTTTGFLSIAVNILSFVAIVAIYIYTLNRDKARRKFARLR